MINGADERVAEAVARLRAALGEYHIKTRPGENNDPSIYAYIRTDHQGTPVHDLYVFTRGERICWWGAERHSIDDVPEAARDIARIVEQQTNPLRRLPDRRAVPTRWEGQPDAP